MARSSASFPGPVTTSSCAGGPKLPKEQGVILVTEHNAEVNAGFVVLRGSNHAPPLLEAMNPQVIQIQSDLPIFWFSAGCCHG